MRRRFFSLGTCDECVESDVRIESLDFTKARIDDACNAVESQ